MKFIKSEEITDFGKVWTYVDDGGMGKFCLYFYDDDPATAYLSNVSVTEGYRKMGFGNRILKMAEKQACKAGCVTLMLRVLDESWMHEWYERHGFQDFMVDGEEEGYLWMSKKIG